MSHIIDSTSVSHPRKIEGYQAEGREKSHHEGELSGVDTMSRQIFTQFNRYMRVGVCTLNQWAMDWDGNLKRIITAIRKSYSEGAGIHVGLELEICSYSNLDHFHERDTETHSFESLAKILEISKEMDMLIVTGMPIRFRSALYNCMIILSKGKIHLIHPKSALCDDDVYRESRYFKSWKLGTELQKLNVRAFGIDQDDVPFGHGIVETADGVKVAIEICEELWAAKNPSVLWALQGVDIICNGSGSHHVLGKSAKRICQLVQDLSSKLGGIYLYSNLRGFDGDRVYFDGMSAILQNGQIYKQIAQFDLEDVAVETALLDLNASKAYRGKIASLCELSSRSQPIQTIKIDLEVISSETQLDSPVKQEFMTERQELFHAPPAYLWHYLRRSGASGYFLPLSGGADSAAVAAMVYLMCDKVCKTVRRYKEAGIPPDHCIDFLGKPVTETDPKELVKRLFFTSYMKSKNSSDKTRIRAENVAKCIGANFTIQEIDDNVDAFKKLVAKSLNIELSHDHPDRRVQLALENLQARTRMVLSYLNAQIGPVAAGISGFLLTLGSSNVDESLVGYLTKYDCSSADINPIGSINKLDLRMFLRDFADLGFEPFRAIVEAAPTAELRPAVDGENEQTDEDEIGVTYAQMQEIGLLRKPGHNGLFSTFFILASRWTHLLPTETAEIVIKFYTRYTRNRHKAAVSTPALVSNIYCVDDQRTDHRPIVYPDFTPQFERLRRIAQSMLNNTGKRETMEHEKGSKSLD